MTSDEILRHRVNSFLLPPPGGEAVRFILDELYRHGVEEVEKERERLRDYILHRRFKRDTDRQIVESILEFEAYLTPPAGAEG
jgi:hypothetical protein